MSHRQFRLLAAYAVLLLGATVAQAQVGLRFALDRTSYLQFENIYARVEMRNYTGRTLVFGESEELRGDLEFWIDNPTGERVLPRASAQAHNPVQGTIVKPGATAEIVVPISRLYLIDKLGRHTVKAVLRHAMLPQEYESNTLNFTVVNGNPVWERIIGVPDIMLREEDSKTVATRRACILTFYDGINKVYSLIIDDDRYIYGVVRLGHDIGHFPPQSEVDGLSRIHILIQISPQVFSYFLFDHNAELDEKAVYVRTDVSPQLVRDPQEGTVLVVGGRKALKGVDYVEKDGMPVPPAKPSADPVFIPEAEIPTPTPDAAP